MADLRKIFSKIYDRYIDKIYRFIFFKVNSQEVAEDLTSETFLRTWEAYKNQKSTPHQILVGGKNQKEIENIQAFLYQTARNLVTDYYREKGKAQLISADYYSPITDPRQNLEERAMLRSDINTIRKALVELKDDYQNVIIWHYLDDLPISEVANLLDRTEEATRVLLHRALESLRQKLNSA